MNLLSINTTLPTDIEYQGKTISTGIFKQPIEGSIFVAKDNLKGDLQADLKNHGGEHKAVYAFSADHYPYWSDVLQNSELKPGIFGENLTISGFDESSLHIGDQLSIGQCVLEITQPRVPCFKLGIAFKNKNMPRLFIENFATGIYLRVLQEGFVEAGNTVKLIKEGKFKVSVQSLFRAYFDKNYQASRSIMETAVLIPELSSEWTKKLSVRLSSLN
ncbi:MAG: MOSC domain-containing protein [Methylococcales bacterium]|nr:MOSC domain-containing protein [Methylococcales bacterium]